MTTKKSKVEETIQATARAGTDAATKAFAMSQERIEALVKGLDEVSIFGKQNVEAIIAASNAAAKGFETLNAEVLAYGKSAVEDSIAASKALFGAKTLQELVELQASYAKISFDSFVQQSTRLGELSAKLAQDALEPINARVQATVGKLVRAA